MPVAAPAPALSSSWFCAGPVAPASGGTALADGRLVVTNASSQTLRGTVTFAPSSGAAVTQDLQVGPTDRVIVPEKTSSSAPYLGAVVNLQGGQATVSQVVAGAAGTSSTACATSGSTSWYFPAGTTQENSTLTLSLLNPYPDDAIADFSFTTEQGQESPQDFQGIVVPAGTMAAFDLGKHLRGRAAVAAMVSLRVGRLVAFETQTVQAMSPAQMAALPPGSTPWPPGVSLTLGSPSAGTSWRWPSGAGGDGTTEQYVIYNPGAKAAQVSLAVDLDQGTADPLQVSVDPHAVAVVATNAESRIPKGVGHGAVLRSTNGVGVVAERVVLATTPAGPTGVAEVFGARLQAGRWMVPGDGATTPVVASLTVYNPNAVKVTVSISSLNGALSVLDGQGAVAIQPHRRYVLAASTPRADGALVVAAQGGAQIVVENDISPSKGLGIDASVGVPLG
jgi:hypothetical protein